MGKKPKKVAYVVRRGRNPGVYLTWDECKSQVDGYQGNDYCGYYTLHEAEAAWQKHCSEQDAEAPFQTQFSNSGSHLHEATNNFQSKSQL
jgi:ribonuclease HI